MTDAPKRRPHTSRARDGHWQVGIEVRCDRCSETVRGLVCLAETYEAAATDAQAMVDAEARDRGWRVETNGARCPRCKTR